MSHDRKPHPKNVPGDFYVDYECCLDCQIPTDMAPDLFARDDSYACFVKKQPATDIELDLMVEVTEHQDMDCIRYRGDDPRIQRRVSSCDRDGGSPQAPRRWWQFWT